MDLLTFFAGVIVGGFFGVAATALAAANKIGRD